MACMFKLYLFLQPDGEMQNQLRLKERELLELKKRKLELELVATQKHIEEQEKAMSMIPLVQATMTGNQLAPLFGSTQMRPRIAPVNSALIASVRLRDPRVSRQMHPQGQAQLFARFPNPQLHSYGPRHLIHLAPEPPTTTTSVSELSARPKMTVRLKNDKSSSSDKTSRSSSSSASRTDRKDSKKSPHRGDSKKTSPRKSGSSRKLLAAEAKVSSTCDIEAIDSPIRASPVPSVKLVGKQSVSPTSPPFVPRNSHDVTPLKVPAITSSSDLANREANGNDKKRLSQDHIESGNKKARIEKLDK